MENQWKRPNTIAGSAAEGEKYFRRVNTEKHFWAEIEKGNHILFTAPRRVGKSSVMKYLADNELEGYECEYQNIQSIITSKEFYQRLFELVYDQLKLFNKGRTKAKQLISKFKIEEITKDGVKIGERNFDFKEALLNVIGRLESADLKIALFLDEFPDVIKLINQFEGKKAAVDVLYTLRSIRQDSNFKKHFTLILAGSIGLNHIVQEISRQSVINDLHEINLKALSENEVGSFFEHLVGQASITIDESNQEYLISKIKYRLPYFIQLLIVECDKILYEEQRTKVLASDIDSAYETVLKNNSNFSDWKYRLKQYFPDSKSFFFEILKNCAHQGALSLQELYDISVKHDSKDECFDKIDNVLVKDGYLVKEDKTYRFRSPFLEDWWKRQHPIIE